METGEQILYEIRANSSQLLTEIAKTQASLSGFKKKQKELEQSTSRLNKMFGEAGTAVKAFLAKITVQSLSRFVEFAGRVDSIRTSFYNLTGTSREASDALVASIREAANGSMSNLDIMSNSALAMQLMGEEVADKLPQMARIALASARATGQDASQMLGDIVRASGRQSVMILDNLGISSVRAGQLQDEYARRLGKTREQLTEAEKSQAFFHAVLTAGTEIIERSGMGTMTLGERIQRLKAQAENAAESFSARLIPALNELMDSLSDEESGAGLIDFFGKVTASLVLMGTIFIESLKGVGDMFSNWWAKVRESFWEDMERLAIAGRDFADNLGWGALARRFEDARRGAEGYWQEARRDELATNGLRNRINELTDQLNNTWNSPNSSGQQATRNIRRQQEAHEAAGRAAARQAKEIKNLQTEYVRFMEIDTDISYISESDFLEQQERLAERFERLRSAQDAGGNPLFDESQLEEISRRFFERGEQLIARTSVITTQMAQGIQSSIQTAFSSIDQANRQLIYNMMWAKGGWKEFQKTMKEIMKQLLADITYMVIRALAVQAILAGIGFSTGGLGGGFLAGAVSGLVGKLQKGGVPASSGEKIKIPILASGRVPADHFLSYIAANEAVINARSTAANAGLLKWINDNPGQQVQAQSVITHTVLNLDGKTLTEVVDRHQAGNARARGTTTYQRRG